MHIDIHVLVFVRYPCWHNDINYFHIVWSSDTSAILMMKKEDYDANRFFAMNFNKLFFFTEIQLIKPRP